MKSTDGWRTSSTLCSWFRERILTVSQEELVRRLKPTRNVIANIETGRRAVLMGDFVMISQALRIDPERLPRRILQW